MRSWPTTQELKDNINMTKSEGLDRLLGWNRSHLNEIIKYLADNRIFFEGENRHGIGLSYSELPACIELQNLPHLFIYQTIIELVKLPLHGYHICLLKIQPFGLDNLIFPVVGHLSLTMGKVLEGVEVGGTTGVVFEVPDRLNLDVPVRGSSVEVVLRYLEAPVNGSAYSSLALVALELVLRYLEAPSFK